MWSRQPYEINASGWKAQIYGFAEFDMIHDSSRSFGDSENNAAIARPTSSAIPAAGAAPASNFASTVGRTSFTTRNSRFGVKVGAPAFEGVKPSAVIEVDFMANPGAFSANSLAAGNISEASLFNNGVFRTRHAYVKLETDVIDILGGQTYYIFGNQAYFQPCAVDFLPLPNEIFGRTPQFRISHVFKTDPVNVELIAGAMRPPQRDSETPEGQGSLKISVNGFKAMRTGGSGGTAADPAAIAVSGAVRRFKVDNQVAPLASSNSATGWGAAVDLLLPIIPVPDANHRGNGFTLNGEFSTGTGYADLLGGLNGGASFPPSPAAAATGAPPNPTFTTPNVDSGMVTYDAAGALKTINWRSFMVGAQYYLPPNGRFFVSANYTQSDSDNLIDLMGGADSARGRAAFKRARYFDGNIFFDITPQTRTGVSYHWASQTYGDGAEAKNTRFMGAMYYFF